MKVYSKIGNECAGFVKTNEKIEITFGGWDGKSYNGETRKMNVWTLDCRPNDKFVHIRKSFNGEKLDCFMIVTKDLHEITNVPLVRLYSYDEVEYTER